MKKYALTALCVIFALCAFALALTGCRADNETEYGNWQTVTAATCEADGEEIRVSLNNPEIVERRAIPAKGHDWNEWTTAVEPTCLVAGVETRTCNNCDNLDKRAIPALGHSFGQWQTVLEPDCVNTGTQIRICEHDGTHTEMQRISALGHDFGEWVVTLAPTCTVAGVETRYCRNCNDHTERRPVEALGHAWSEAVLTVAPTCTEKGEEKSVCVNDDSHVKYHTVSAHGHSYSDWVVSVAPTESQDGEETRVCRNDPTHVQTRILPALGSEGLRYELNAGGTEYSVGRDYVTTLRGTVYIPAVHNGLPVTTILSMAFSSMEMENVVFLGNNLRTVQTNVFYHCPNLKSVTFPEGITKFFPYTFNDCPALTSVSYPASAVLIGATSEIARSSRIMRACPNLTELTVAEGNAVYRSENNCIINRETNTLLAGTNNCEIPQSVTAIGSRAFEYSGIVNITIPANVQSIGYAAFGHCAYLREVVFEGNSVTLLDNTFEHCKNLQSVILPQGLTKIGGAFYDCDSLKDLVIPASVTDISPMSFTSNCIKTLTFASDNETYVKDGNCIIEKKSNILVCATDDAVIPDYVEMIGPSAFSGQNIESIVIPASVKGIGLDAFRNCKNLKSVTFAAGSQVEIIGESAFENCTSLTALILPSQLTTIYGEAFKGAAIKRLVIPASVTTVDKSEVLNYGAFEGWTAEQTIVVRGFASQQEADEAWGEGWRDGCNATIEYAG